MLQGDVVSTEAAYLMGERIVGTPMFAVLNSTCDLVPGRREYASLLRVFPVTGDGDAFKSAQRWGLQSGSTAWHKFEWRIYCWRRDSVPCPLLVSVSSDRSRGF